MNPFLDVVLLSKDYLDDICFAIEKLINTISKLAGQEIYDPILQAANGVISKNVLDTDMYKFGDVMWETFQAAIDHLISVIEGVENSNAWHEISDRDKIMEGNRRLNIYRKRYFDEFRSNHIWIFFNFYRPYNPFYFREPDGSYTVRAKVICEKAISFDSLGLYFMVSYYRFLFNSFVQTYSLICIA